ncbi:MAG: hypothetical protein ACR2M0_06165 [Chloroflexia bacterium]
MEHARGGRGEDGSTSRALAWRLGWAGAALGVLPWLLIGPLVFYAMDFMLWTWIWPAVLGGMGIAAGLLAMRLGTAPAVARLAVALGLLSLLAALAGFVWMLAGMG